MEIQVQKYGGTSVGSTEKIINVAKRIISTKEETNRKVVVIVSAMGHTTDELVELSNQVSPNQKNKREMDMLLSTGEQVSISLLAMAINNLGHKAISMTGPQAGFCGEKVFGNARIKNINPDKLIKLLEDDNIIIVAGFQACTDDDEIVTLGRGGSDTSAVALAGALKAKECEIFTDVEGVFTGDPRIIKNAKKLSEISYEEMLELASLGTQVLHPRSVECASIHNTVLHVRSTFSKNIGTYVKGVEQLEIRNLVSGVSLDKDQAKIALIDIPDQPGMAAQLFSIIAKNGFSVDMIIQSQSLRETQTNDIAFTVSSADLDDVVKITQDFAKEVGCKEVILDQNVAKVSIVGEGMVGRPGVAADMFKALADDNINIQMISTSEIKISCIVHIDKAEQSIKIIHKTFFE